MIAVVEVLPVTSVVADVPQMKLTLVDIPKINLPQLNPFSTNLPQLELPNLNLTESLNTLGSFASQGQTIVTAALNHPFLAIGTIVVSIGLIQLIADLVKRVLRAGIRLILTLPFTLSRWIWNRATASLETATHEKAKIAQLIERLETLRAEQDEVVTELKGLIDSSAAISETTPPLQSANSGSSALQKSAESPQS